MVSGIWEGTNQTLEGEEQGIARKQDGENSMERAMTGAVPKVVCLFAIHSSGSSGAVPKGGERGITTEQYHSTLRLAFAGDTQGVAENHYSYGQGCGYLK